MGLIRVVGVLVVVVACDKGKVPPSEVEPTKGSAQRDDRPVRVRVCNDTSKRIEALEWNIGGTRTAAVLNAGECTEYEEAKFAYDYGMAKFKVGNDELTSPGQIAEIPLPPGGTYTFHIKIVDYDHRKAEMTLGTGSRREEEMP
jgi:hypothetical protein